MSSQPSTSNHVVVLGGGVIGLSTAIALLDHPRAHPYTVTLIAADLPFLPKGGGANQATQFPRPRQRHPASYASAWAGAHHVSDPKSQREAAWDKTCFQTLVALQEQEQREIRRLAAGGRRRARPGVASPRRSLVWCRQREYWAEGNATPGLGDAPGPLAAVHWYPEFRAIDASMLPQGISHGASFLTLDINVPVYLERLQRRFLRLGGRLMRASVGSVAEALSLASSPTAPGWTVEGAGYDARARREAVLRVDDDEELACRFAAVAWPKPRTVVVACGLGARSLTDVRDPLVHPVRGQVVLLNTPHLDSLPSSHHHGGGGGGSGGSAGGAVGFDDDEARRPGSIRAFPIDGGVSLCNAPESSDARSGFRDAYLIPRGDGTCIAGGTRLVGVWDPHPDPSTTQAILSRVRRMPNADVALRTSRPRVLGVNVGLRPARDGGPRLAKAREGELSDGDGTGQADVVWCYGFGGAGYQNSWGAAFEARNLVDDLAGLERAPTPDAARPGLASLAAASPPSSGSATTPSSAATARGDEDKRARPQHAPPPPSAMAVGRQSRM